MKVVPRYLGKLPLVRCAKFLMAFLRLGPPGKSKYLVSNAQLIDVRSDFENGTRCAVTKDLRMLNPQATVVLV
jgi:hypothetical protein